MSNRLKLFSGIKSGEMKARVEKINQNGLQAKEKSSEAQHIGTDTAVQTRICSETKQAV